MLSNSRFSQPAITGLWLLLLSTLLISDKILALEFKGDVGAEARWFTAQQKSQFSASSELEAYWRSEQGNDSITAKIFGRLDSEDNERTHADIRELSWLHYSDSWELNVGISKVFWGVTESAHRVDIINQTDSVESLDGEQKLGQPMLQFTGIQSWGTLSTFVMPYFRERTFNGPDGYLSFNLPVDIDNPLYESNDEEKHIDWALRYSHTFNIWDLGISYFSGTSREPLLLPSVNALNQTVLTPYYPLIEQAGIDVQATVGQWLWKMEAINQKTDRNALKNTSSFFALTGGFEYTLVGIFESNTDLGLLAEYHHNSEGEESADVFQNDLFVGARLALNNIADTSLLIGIVKDLDYSKSYQGFIEGSRRLGDSWVATLDARVLNAEDTDDLLAQLTKKDLITFDLSYYF